MTGASRAAWASLTVALGLAAPASAASIFPSSPFTDDAAGTTGAAFLKIPVGARSGALGTSQAALSGEPDAVFWNPAGLAAVDRPAASVSYSALLQTTYLGSLSLAYPAGPGTLGAGVRYFSQSPLQSFDSVGDLTGSFTPYDLALEMAYAVDLGGWSAGAGFTALHSELASQSGGTVAFDAGLLGREVTTLRGGPVDFGVFFRNLGAPLDLGGGADPLPFELAAGAFWKADTWLNILVDMQAPVDASPYATIGAEAHRAFQGGVEGALRVGYDRMAARDVPGLSGLTAGAGLSMNGLRLDYAWVAFGDVGMTHRVTLSYGFGTERPRPHPAAAPAPKPVIAVLGFEPNGLEAYWAAEASEFLADTLEGGKRFVVADRAKPGFAAPECGDAICAVQLGRAAGADKAVFGSLAKVAAGYSLSVGLIDVPTGRTEFSGTETAQEAADLRAAARSLARRIEAAMPR